MQNILVFMYALKALIVVAVLTQPFHPAAQGYHCRDIVMEGRVNVNDAIKNSNSRVIIMMLPL